MGAEQGKTNVVRFHLGLGPNEVLNQMNGAGTTRATLIPDIQGSIVGALDAASGALSKSGYQAYGESGSAAGSFRYTGQRIDPETNGLYYYRARMYAPAWGRFMQPDLIGYSGGINLYAYGGNDPLNLVDPYGLAADSPQSESFASNVWNTATGPLQNEISQYSSAGSWTTGNETNAASLVQPLQIRTNLSTSATVQYMAMSWEERRRGFFGQQQLELFGGGGGAAPSLPQFERGGPTVGVLQTPNAPDVPLISGVGGPATNMPPGSPGFDIVTRTHVEGQAAALMQQLGLNQGTLYINNPSICSSCAALLPRMLPPGATLDVVLPNGTVVPFVGSIR